MMKGDKSSRFVLWVLLLVTAPGWAQWGPHKVIQLSSKGGETQLAAKFQMVTESWNRAFGILPLRAVLCPYLVYMPEKNRVLMLASGDYPYNALVLWSDDRGRTWSAAKWVHVDASGRPDTGMGVGLTYLGKGHVFFQANGGRWSSHDYGESWEGPVPVPKASNGRDWGEWDPLLVDKDPKSGKVVRLMSYGSDNLQPDGHFQGYIRFSSDEGATWSKDIKVPEMYAVNEVAFVRAKNGDIVAACRTDNPERFKKEIDHYGGLSVSISRDNGYTWSKLQQLYEWGRHHPSMVLLRNSNIVMTYVVRKGYPDTDDG